MVRFTSLLVAALSASVVSATERNLADSCAVDAMPLGFPLRVTDAGPFKKPQGQGCTVNSNPKCKDMGFDWGYKISSGNTEGCQSRPAGTQWSALGTTTTTSDTCAAPSGTIETSCSGATGSQYKFITVAPTQTVYVFVKAGTGGTVYKVVGGTTATLDFDQGVDTNGKGISHVEFCFNCDEAPAPTPATPVTPAATPTPATPVTPAPVTPAATPTAPAPATPVTEPTSNPPVAPDATCVSEGDMAVPSLSLYELAKMGEDEGDREKYFPYCGDLGQNEAFQGQDLIVTKGNQDPECVRVNICHGNAGFGWNRITVDRDAIGIGNNGKGGHAKFEHNDPSQNKRPDFFPGGYSVPNPNGAGKNGYLDGACNFIPSCESGDDPVPGEDAPVTTAPSPAPATPVTPAATPTAPATPVTPDADPVGDNEDPKAFTRGDPHFKTFGGELYDYHGQCDMVLLSNPNFKNGLGMTVHIRTKIQDFWSSVESAAIKIGEDFLEVAGGEGKEWIWVNGEANEVLEEQTWYRTSLAGFLVRFKQTGSVREANIYLEGAKEVLVIKTYHDFVRVDINWVDSENYGGSVGLLGAKDNEGIRVGRDGTEIKDVNAFGQEWQVKEDEDKLFHNYDPTVVQAPAKCVLPPSMTDEKIALRKRRLAESDLTEEKAEKACEHVQGASERKACVYDILATQDINMAGAW